MTHVIKRLLHRSARSRQTARPTNRAPERRSLRKRQVIDAFKASPTDANFRKGTYWGTRTNIADYRLADALDCRYDRTLMLAAGLATMDDVLPQRLINWGYAVRDAALRKHVEPGLAPKPVFPYPIGV